jgi:hypothetical protein
MKTLLTYAKDWKVWHKHRGNTAVTVEIPTEKSIQAQKTKYIQMIQTHGSVQLSLGAATLKGLIDADTSLTLRLLPDADGNERPPTVKLVWEIFNLMESNYKNVWICMSTGSNGMSTGYFSSGVQEISEHVAAFIACPGAQVYWWLRHRKCIPADINNLIRHCFTLSQQQKVTSSKYLKDFIHAVVDRTDGDNIILASTSEGIYDLTLGLSDRERRSLVTTRGYNTAAITYGKAKEGAVEAHNSSAAVSVTSLHSAKGKEPDEKSVTAQTLVISVYSIGTSRVTKDLDDESDKEKGEDKADGGSDSKQVAIDGMDILHSNGKHRAMLFSMTSMDERSAQAKKEGSAGEKTMEGVSARGEELDSSKEKEWQDEGNEESYLTAKMNTATAQFNLDSNDKGSNFQENKTSVRSNELDLHLQEHTGGVVGRIQCSIHQEVRQPQNLSACPVKCSRAISGRYGYLLGYY